MPDSKNLKWADGFATDADALKKAIKEKGVLEDVKSGLGKLF